MREFLAGAGLLLRGLGQWRRTPGAMALGLIPGTLVGLVFGAALVTWGIALPGLVDDWTPFADGWVPFWAGALRTAIGVASFGAALLLAVVSFTAVTLAVGEPFYDRIWRATEYSAIGEVPDAEYGFWRAVGDSALLVLRGIPAALLAWLLGLIPFVGGVVGFVAGVLLTGWLLADELTSRALSARGLDRRARSRCPPPASDRAQRAGRDLLRQHPGQQRVGRARSGARRAARAVKGGHRAIPTRLRAGPKESVSRPPG